MHYIQDQFDHSAATHASIEAVSRYVLIFSGWRHCSQQIQLLFLKDHRQPPAGMDSALRYNVVAGQGKLTQALKR